MRCAAMDFPGNVRWENEGAEVRRSDGAYRWFLIQYNPLFDKPGQPFSLVRSGNRY